MQWEGERGEELKKKQKEKVGNGWGRRNQIHNSQVRKHRIIKVLLKILPLVIYGLYKDSNITLHLTVGWSTVSFTSSYCS